MLIGGQYNLEKQHLLLFMGRNNSLQPLPNEQNRDLIPKTSWQTDSDKCLITVE